MGVRALPLAVFLLAYPAATLVVRGAAGALLLLAALCALVAILLPTRWSGLPKVDTPCMVKAFCIALACPLLAVIASEVWNSRMLMRAFDSPARFLVAVPLFLMLRRVPRDRLRWADTSFAIGAILTLAVVLIWPYRDGSFRMGRPFLNPLHFGDIALSVGILSGLSVDWWRKDGAAVRALKIAGLCAGVYASLLSKTRGGWVAIPVLLAVGIYIMGRRRPGKWVVVLPLALVLLFAVAYLALPVVQDRIHMVWSDFHEYSLGNKDTSVGDRLQIYQAALMLIPRSWVFGLGAEGFCAHMPELVDAGVMTKMAGELGCGETHNEMLAALANYGLVGGVAWAALYIVPGVLFWKRLEAPSASARGAALMGVMFVIAFFVFGWTIETFNLKLTTSYFATVVAILAAIASHPDGSAS
jgi:O-antigen ligase